MSVPEPSPADEAKRLTLVVNERIKYFSTFLNTLAAAMISVGAAAPIITFTIGAAPDKVAASAVFGGALLCIAAGAILHGVVQMLLGGPKP